MIAAISIEALVFLSIIGKLVLVIIRLREELKDSEGAYNELAEFIKEEAAQ